MVLVGLGYIKKTNLGQNDRRISVHTQPLVVIEVCESELMDKGTLESREGFRFRLYEVEVSEEYPHDGALGALAHVVLNAFQELVQMVIECAEVRDALLDPL